MADSIVSPTPFPLMTSLSQERVRELLATIIDPHTGQDLVASGALKGVGVDGDKIAVDALLRHGGPDVLRELYARRRAAYQQYVDRYFRGSWEEAITDWWGEKIRVQS